MEQQDNRPGHAVNPIFANMLGGMAVLPPGALVLIGVPPGRRPDVTGFLHRFFPYHPGDHFSYTSGRVAHLKYDTIDIERFAEGTAEELRKAYSKDTADVSVAIVDFEGLSSEGNGSGRRAIRVLRKVAEEINLPIVVITEVDSAPELKGCFQAPYRIDEDPQHEADLELFVSYHPTAASADGPAINIPATHWKVHRGKFRSSRRVSSEAHLFLHLPRNP